MANSMDSASFLWAWSFWVDTDSTSSTVFSPDTSLTQGFITRQIEAVGHAAVQPLKPNVVHIGLSPGALQAVSHCPFTSKYRNDSGKRPGNPS